MTANSHLEMCPVCWAVGPIVKLCMGMERAFHTDWESPTHCFNPCGHMASEATVRLINMGDNIVVFFLSMCGNFFLNLFDPLQVLVFRIGAIGSAWFSINMSILCHAVRGHWFHQTHFPGSFG